MQTHNDTHRHTHSYSAPLRSTHGSQCECSMISAGKQRVFAEVKGAWSAVKQAIYLAHWRRPFWDDYGVSSFIKWTQFLLPWCPALLSQPLSAHAQTNTRPTSSTFPHANLFQTSDFWAASFPPGQSWAQIHLNDMSTLERGKRIRRAVKNYRQRKKLRQRARGQICGTINDLVRI